MARATVALLSTFLCWWVLRLPYDTSTGNGVKPLTEYRIIGKALLVPLYCQWTISSGGTS
jgi:hypothetical protein